MGNSSAFFMKILAILALSTISLAFDCSSSPCATKINFAPNDVLNGDDGLPPHPLQPLPYGKPVYPITTTGDGLEMVEAHFSYWEGKYWMYSATWGCGGSLFVYAIPPYGEWPAELVYEPGDYGADGNCGIKSFSSVDLTNWELEDFYQPSMSVANVTKPLVRYSDESGLYVMFMGGDRDKGLYYATSSSPGGPWSDPPVLFGGSIANHDFDVMVAPNGTHYLVSDPFTTKSADGQMYIWDIWVHQLTPNLTSLVGTNETSVRIRTAQELEAQGLFLEAGSAFYYDGYYYLLFGMTCQNCAGYIYGFYATEPFGPYTDLGVISADGCGGQNKGASVLPTPDGGSVVINHVLGYRTSPNNYVISHNSYMQALIPENNYIWHADNHQAASSTFLFPLEFEEDHTIRNLTCPSQVKIPLVNSTTSPEPPTPFQLDCRIRTWQNIEATYAVAKTGSTLEFPVWQRTDNLGPTNNAGPVLDGILEVALSYEDGTVDTFSWVPSNISWAPAKISMDVEGKYISKITLSTNATNGCYGTLVQPKVDQNSSYGTWVPGLGSGQLQELSELYVYQW